MFTGSLTIHGGHLPPPVLRIEPGDTIVISTPDRHPREYIEAMKRNGSKAFPGHKIIVLSAGTTISTIRDHSSTESSSSSSTSSPDL